MGIGTRLVACPSCSCHAFARETVCPNCGAALRTSDGTLPRTAGAVMLGLTLVTASVSACTDDTKTAGAGAGSNGEGGMTTSTMAGSFAASSYGSSSSGGPLGGMGGMGGAGGAGGTSGMGGKGGAGGVDGGP